MRNDITRTTLAVLFIGLLIIASLWIVRPFLAAVIWATMVVVATWPLMLRVQRGLWGRRSLAVAVMTFAMLLVFVLPFWTAIGAIVDYSDKLGEWGHNLKDLKIPPPPAVVEMIPIFGGKIASTWRDLAAMPPEDLAAKLGPYVGMIVKWVATEAGTVGMLLVQLRPWSSRQSCTRAARPRRRACAGSARRLAGQTGATDVAVLAGAGDPRRGAGGGGDRGGAVGAGRTSGWSLAGVPLAGVLTAVMLMLCLAQVGADAGAACRRWRGRTGAGTAAGARCCWCGRSFVGSAGQRHWRPYLIKMGADLPLLLIFAGVIGGLDLAWGWWASSSGRWCWR